MSWRAWTLVPLSMSTWAIHKAGATLDHFFFWNCYKAIEHWLMQFFQSCLAHTKPLFDTDWPTTCHSPTHSLPPTALFVVHVHSCCMQQSEQLSIFIHAFIYVLVDIWVGHRYTVPIVLSPTLFLWHIQCCRASVLQWCGCTIVRWPRGPYGGQCATEHNNCSLWKLWRRVH